MDVEVAKIHSKHRSSYETAKRKKETHTSFLFLLETAKVIASAWGKNVTICLT